VNAPIALFPYLLTAKKWISNNPVKYFDGGGVRFAEVLENPPFKKVPLLDVFNDFLVLLHGVKPLSGKPSYHFRRRRQYPSQGCLVNSESEFWVEK
jgi:hypothetical protein